MSSTADASPPSRPELLLQRAEHALLDPRGETRAEVLVAARDVPLELVAGVGGLGGAGGVGAATDFSTAASATLGNFVALEIVDRDLEDPLRLVDPAQVASGRSGTPTRRPAALTRAARVSSPRAGSARRARRCRSAPRARRRGRRSPPRGSRARRCAGPSARARPRLRARSPSRARAEPRPPRSPRPARAGNAKKNASPCVSISIPSRARNVSRTMPTVRRQHLAVVVAEALEELGRVLDVGEREGDRSAG